MTSTTSSSATKADRPDDVVCPPWCCISQEQHRQELAEEAATYCIHQFRDVIFTGSDGAELQVNTSSVTQPDGTTIEPTSVDVGTVNLTPHDARRLAILLDWFADQADWTNRQTAAGVEAIKAAGCPSWCVVDHQADQRVFPGLEAFHRGREHAVDAGGVSIDDVRRRSVRLMQTAGAEIEISLSDLDGISPDRVKSLIEALIAVVAEVPSRGTRQVAPLVTRAHVEAADGLITSRFEGDR